MTDQAGNHAELMNATYRRQRLIYDLSRKYFLLGRDHLVKYLHPPSGGHVLEVACGTGRNLAHVARKRLGCDLYGLDISTEMLRSADRRLYGRAQLAQGDACNFDPHALFGVDGFHRIILSYSLSMIPDWEGALREAVRHLAEGGELHIVDFGDQGDLPAPFKRGLRQWLAKFHVTPRDTLPTVLEELALAEGARVEQTMLYRRYAQYAVFVKA
ncbi:class I SAM-dependent methyltransferase [Actibacterium sp. 188UL27-1]|uniref:class I SAM-dependent methyltransferase n=1 Tax=Actibacterium sp. 188UL27-1 TaxID=2786961 RepID=UPI00195BABA4|nr:class I SAM-dependent methyltransferase [Actibacterium sp. 188UL27-1]MBM7067467.1 class I SAM-dependent methyltransferase [Actibacterium sp. 188UL27-1]